MAVDNNNVPNAPPSKTGLWKPMLLIGLVLAVMALAWYLDAGAYIQQLRDWIGSMGWWGLAVFVAIYAMATVLALPGMAMSALAAGLFGTVWGVVAVSLGSTIGATLAFLVARYFARGAIENRLSGNEKFRKLDKMTAEHGDIIVAITRLVPLFPFNLLNYGLGLTHVSLGKYVFWSWLCMLPGTVLYVAGFDAVFTGLEQGRVPWSLVAVVAVMIAVVLLLIRKARARLSRDS